MRSIVRKRRLGGVFKIVMAGKSATSGRWLSVKALRADDGVRNRPGVPETAGRKGPNSPQSLRSSVIRSDRRFLAEPSYH